MNKTPVEIEPKVVNNSLLVKTKPFKIARTSLQEVRGLFSIVLHEKTQPEANIEDQIRFGCNIMAP